MLLLCTIASCDITCTLQNGLQPIHHAAQEGHEDIVMILVDDFNVKPDVVSLVRLCPVNSVVMLRTIVYGAYVTMHLHSQSILYVCIMDNLKI